ncbi:M1 family metallopeptidase [Arthrobacter sp. 2MCAF14]|uniref:M1 family metallopeptidase n=1 Tax=Arthrobacter sp. 2MCAF14 TaxID=3232982 RepID=UPI003F911DB2
MASPSCTGRRLAAAALASSLVLAACTPGSGVTGTPTMPGAGDSYYPGLGNTGYTADHYGLNLDIDPARGSISGTATIDAHATADLPRFSLDLVGLDVHGVSVDGQVATPSRQGDKLVVVPAHPLSSGAHFSVAVTYSGTPQPIPDPSGNRTGADKVGWHHDGDEVYVASEVSGARTWYPVNDTPRNKATYSFSLTVPAGFTAVANGTPRGQTPHGSTTTFAWESTAPMASYLAAVDVGRFDQITATGPHGLPITVYAPADLSAAARARFAQLPDMIAYFETLLGPYPFDTAGAVVVSTNFRWSLETQTRPVYGSQVLTMNTETAAEGISHELAHQWFGDSRTPSNWSGIWLNEGFATYLSWVWLEHTAQRDYLTGLMESQYGYELNAPNYATLLNHTDLPPDQILPVLRRLFQPGGHPVPDAQILSAMGLNSPSGLTSAKALGLLGVKPGSADVAGYLEDGRSSAPVSPPATDLFTGGVYNRGAMTLQALRVRVGDATFFRILSTYAAEHRYGNATTDDFIHTAEIVSHTALDSFFQTWLRDPAAPPMPALLPTQ